MTGSTIVKVFPLRSKLAPEFMVVAPPIPPNTLLAAAHFKMPPFMMMPPVTAATELKVTVLFPVFVNVEVPE